MRNMLSVFLLYRLRFVMIKIPNILLSQIKQSLSSELRCRMLQNIPHTLYKLKRCSNEECCKQCRCVKFKGTMTKWPVQKLTHRTTQKHAQHHDATDI